MNTGIPSTITNDGIPSITNVESFIEGLVPPLSPTHLYCCLVKINPSTKLL